MLSTFKHGGKLIYYLDISNLTTEDMDKIVQDMDAAKKLIAQNPPKSTLLITNVTNVKFNSQMAEIFKQYANHNTPYVKASALVGVSGVQKIIFHTVKRLTGRDFYLANSMEEAKEWLGNQ